MKMQSLMPKILFLALVFAFVFSFAAVFAPAVALAQDAPPAVITETPPPVFTPTPTLPPPPTVTPEPVPIPEPITVVLFGTGLAALSAAAASRRNKE